MKITLGKLFLILVILGSLIFMFRPLVDPDFWWHIKTGQVILLEKQIPHFDVFSFTAVGKPWIAHEWLSEVILYLTYKLGGITTTQIIFSFLITFAFVLSACRVENRKNHYAIGGALLLGMIGSTPILWARPQAFSIIYFSIFIYLLEKYLKNGKKSLLIPLPILMVLWVNQHGAYIIGLGAIGIFILSLLIENTIHLVREKGRIIGIFTVPVLVLGILLLICTFASILNPNGIRILLYPFQTVNDPSLQGYIQEWASPNFHEKTWIPLAVLYLCLIGFGLRGKKQVSTVNTILCVVFGFLALLAIKQIAFFAIVVIPILSDLISDVIPFHQSEKRSTKSVIGISLLTLIGIIIFGVYQISQINTKQAEFEKQFFPVNAVQFIKKEKIIGNIFNSYNWGGYLIWNMYPETKVYIDGRNDMYGANFVQRFVDIYYAKPGWQNALRTDKIEYVLIEPKTYLAFALQQSTDWVTIYGDDVSLLFQRNIH
jgi:hypothetical protein